MTAVNKTRQVNDDSNGTLALYYRGSKPGCRTPEPSQPFPSASPLPDPSDPHLPSHPHL